MILVLACAPAGAPSPAVLSDTEDTTPPADTAPPPQPTVPTVPTVPVTTPPAPYDCANLPATGTFITDHEYFPPFEDFTFSADGYAWGVSLYTGGLTRVPFGGPAELLAPGISGYARGTRFLPDGDLVSVDYPNNALLEIDTKAYTATLLTGALSTPNGVAIGDDGFIYLSQATGEVRRIDPATGESPLLVASPVSNDGISFSPDYRTLYLNSDVTGDFMAIGIDVDGTVTTPLETIATLPGPADGMVVDACGNAYVTQFAPPSIVRVRTDGTVETFIELPADQLIVAANFGTGVGGWERDHLFLSDWIDGMLEFDAGVYGKWEPHLPP